MWTLMGLLISRKMRIEGHFRGCDAQSQCRWCLDGKQAMADDGPLYRTE